MARGSSVPAKPEPTSNPLENHRATTYEQTLAEINLRDQRDVSREDSPLMIAEDAVVIDTSELDLSEVFEQMMQIIQEKSAKVTLNLT